MNIGEWAWIEKTQADNKQLKEIVDDLLTQLVDNKKELTRISNVLTTEQKQQLKKDV